MDYNMFYDFYKQQLDTVVQECHQYPWEDKKTYAAWLRNTHYYAKETPRMLALMGSVMTDKHRNICYRFLRHACEEMGHEKQIEKDLKFLGLKLNDIEVSTEMKICHRSLSYWGQRSSEAIGFMGWVILMEGLAVEAGEFIYNQITNNYGEKAAFFLKSHSDEDPDHIDKALMVLKQLSSEDLELVADSVKMYTQQYMSILRSIRAEKSIKNAA